jgi:hypothetical protein
VALRQQQKLDERIFVYWAGATVPLVASPALTSIAIGRDEPPFQMQTGERQGKIATEIVTKGIDLRQLGVYLLASASKVDNPGTNIEK